MTPAPTWTFGRLLRTLRQYRRMRLQEMARAMGLSSDYLSDVERGLRKPPAEERVRQMAEMVGGDPAVLVMAAQRDRERWV